MSTLEIKESRLSIDDLAELFADAKNSNGNAFFALPAVYQDLYLEYQFAVCTVGSNSAPTAYKVLFVKESGALFEQNFNVRIVNGEIRLTPVKEKQLLKDAFIGDSQVGTPNFYKFEKQFDLDIDGDGFIGTSVLLVDKANQSLLAKDATQLPGNSFYEMLSIDVKGKGAGLTIDTRAALTGVEDENDRRLVIGSRSTNWSDEVTHNTDGLLSNFKLLGSGMSVGFGTSTTGTMTIRNSNIDLAGSLLSTYILDLLGAGLEDSDIAQQTLGVTLIGFGNRASGSLLIENSEINYVRADDIGTNYGVAADQIVEDNNHGSLMGLFIAGSTGATGNVRITGSEVNMLGLTNTFTIGETGGQANATISNSALNLHASYSTSDPRFYDSSEKDLGYNSIQVGLGDGVKTTRVSSLVVSDSDVSLLGTQSNVNVGWEWGVGSLSINNSTVIQYSLRNADAINDGKIDAATYGYAWSGSYFNIGGEWGDGNSTVNELSSGIVNLNNSYYSMYGPHAGISVGGGSTKAVGQLVLSNSVVSVLAGGAIYSTNGSFYDWEISSWDTNPDRASNYLSAGVNSSGHWNSGYFAFVNIGGIGWSDSGGNGEVNLVNGSRMQVFQMDFNSFDEDTADLSGAAQNIDTTFINSSAANFTLGDGGTRAVLTLDNTSILDVGGYIRLAQNESNSASSTKYFLSNDGGIINAYSFNAGDGNNNGTSNRSTTYLNGDAEINAQTVAFDMQSRLVGDGTIRVMDMFSGDIGVYSNDKDTPSIYTDINGNDSIFSISFNNAQILIGDVLTISKTTQAANRPLTGQSRETITTGTGTLRFDTDKDDGEISFLSFASTQFNFDLGASAKDLISIGDFDSVSFSNSTFNIKMDSSLSGGPNIKLVDFDDATAYSASDLSNSNITLLGVRGAALEVIAGDIYLNV